MLRKETFLNFQDKTTLSNLDYFVGFDPEISREIKVTVDTLKTTFLLPNVELLVLRFEPLYSDFQANSANWVSTYETSYNLSANWESTFNTVQSNSAVRWNYQGADLKALSANWESTFSNVKSNSAVRWNYQGTDLKALSANWESTFSNVKSNSAVRWNYQGADLKALSANWESSLNTVQSNSAVRWNYQGTDLKGLSSNWESTFSTVKSLSSSWEESHEIIPTVLDHLSTNNVTVSSLSINKNINVLGNIQSFGKILSGGVDLVEIFNNYENRIKTLEDQILTKISKFTLNVLYWNDVENWDDSEIWDDGVYVFAWDDGEIWNDFDIWEDGIAA